MTRGDLVECAMCNGQGYTWVRDWSYKGAAESKKDLVDCPICEGDGKVIQRGRFKLHVLHENITTPIFTLRQIEVGEKRPIGIMQNFYCNVTGIDRLTWEGQTIQPVLGTTNPKTRHTKILLTSDDL